MTPYASDAKAYRDQQILGADGPHLVLHLFDEAVRRATLGAQAIEAGDAAGRTENLNRVVRIVSHLSDSLDEGAEEGAAAMCESLHALYYFINARMTVALQHGDAQALAEGLHVLQEQRSAWQQICREVEALPQEQTQEAP